MHQAQSAVKIGLEKLREHDIPITRPEDYFAEMVKSDDHMRKVVGIFCGKSGGVLSYFFANRSNSSF